jgi:hypothetical protein
MLNETLDDIGDGDSLIPYFFYVVGVGNRQVYFV